ncbi:MFS transporter [Aureitalea marina]|uniref:MFS transporter n=1 Tax=Aureitalea marina TaxID=930804 RepID=A0A2S7KNB2_9FLAO|nr:MFS transporter [Aureitalea marina]PQB04088.1 MFS transporter [Aureitalea marina]
MGQSAKRQPWHLITLLILAGEAVFILPFVLARVFRPTVLEVFQLTNLQLGTCFSIYGIVALVSYLIGGPLADRYPANKLMGISLILTALGGLWMASSPTYLELKILYGYWGFTTIFLFWAAMIKATRQWGGINSQGRAYGLLDGGRGLVGAAFGSLGVFILGLTITADTGPAEQAMAFRQVIYSSSTLVALIGLIVWFGMRLKDQEDNENAVNKISWSQFRQVMRIPSVWYLMVIILCAYVGYKITDIFSLYAREVMLYDEIDSAQVGTILLYMRPIVGIAIGFLADRSGVINWLIAGFVLTLIGAFIFASGVLDPSLPAFFFSSVLIIATGVYGVRALYFATMQDGMIPLALTGTAVGLISLVGYTPDIFAGPAMGYLLDASPGEAGHQDVFWMLMAFAGVGLIASIGLKRITRT